MKQDFLLSLALHSLLLLPLAFPRGPGKGDGPEGNGAQAQRDDGAMLPPPAEAAQPQVVTMDIALIEEPRPAASQAPDCPSSFGGIGIGHNGIGYVTEVVAGYPAARAGIKVGDILENLDLIRGEAGTPVIVMVRRHGQLQLFQMIRENICTEKPKKEPTP